MTLYSLVVQLLLLLVQLGEAHLGGDFSKELEHRRRFLQNDAANPSHCRERFRREILADGERYRKRALPPSSERGLEGR